MHREEKKVHCTRKYHDKNREGLGKSNRSRNYEGQGVWEEEQKDQGGGGYIKEGFQPGIYQTLNSRMGRQKKGGI